MARELLTQYGLLELVAERRIAMDRLEPARPNVARSVVDRVGRELLVDPGRLADGSDALEVARPRAVCGATEQVKGRIDIPARRRFDRLGQRLAEVAGDLAE